MRAFFFAPGATVISIVTSSLRLGLGQATPASARPTHSTSGRSASAAFTGPTEAALRLILTLRATVADPYGVIFPTSSAASVLLDLTLPGVKGPEA